MSEFEKIVVEHKSGSNPRLIRLLATDAKTVVDSVSAEYEDSFCLETFGSLIVAHQQCNTAKNFIIARVQTWDRKQPEKAFYSYYNAYHLNKILFQTQVYHGKKLIHRLLVLNPLTNSDIIGDIDYFMVFTQYEKKAPLPMPNGEPLKTATLTGQRVDNPMSRRTSIDQRVSFFMKQNMPPGSENADSPNSIIITTNDYHLGSAVVDGNHERSQTAPNQSKKYNKLEDDTVIPLDELKHNRRKSFAVHSVRESAPVPKSISYHKNMSHLQNKTPQSPAERKESPPTPPEQRRNLSLLNAITSETKKSSTPTSPSFHDFKKWSESVNNSRKPSLTTVENDIFDAVAIGNDTDYLEKGKMRKLFLENAIEEEDIKLFEMPEVKENGDDDHNSMMDSPVENFFANENFDNLPWYQKIYAIPPQRSLMLMGRWTRFFHSSKLYMVNILAILIFFVVVYFSLQGKIKKD